MYAYIDRKKKLPVTTLLRAIGFESDKDILNCFDLAEEIKCNRETLEACLGRKLAGHVMKTTIEDFVDEDTGEVSSMERNYIVVDREKELTPEIIDVILESGSKSILLHKEQ
jgi:DNA-directed RNA polymerase subunit beta